MRLLLVVVVRVSVVGVGDGGDASRVSGGGSGEW